MIVKVITLWAHTTDQAGLLLGGLRGIPPKKNKKNKKQQQQQQQQQLGLRLWQMASLSFSGLV